MSNLQATARISQSKARMSVMVAVTHAGASFGARHYSGTWDDRQNGVRLWPVMAWWSYLTLGALWFMAKRKGIRRARRALEEVGLKVRIR